MQDILDWKQGINPKTRRKIKINGRTWNRIKIEMGFEKYENMSEEDIKKNRNLEKFYTKPDIAKQCIEIFFSKIKPDINDLLIEPSYGSGSFFNILKTYEQKVIGFDIDPPVILDNVGDFLKTKFVEKNIHIIGNPPFGRQSKLARKFIKHSVKINAKTISFILPKSFKKESLKKIFPLRYHLVKSFEIPKNSFIFKGETYNVPCVFQIWKKQKINRKRIEKIDPEYFVYVKRENDHDFSIQRVGSKAGSLTLIETEKKSIQSHYFIKLNPNILLEKFVLEYNNVKFKFDNSVGPLSISKMELNKIINSFPSEKIIDKFYNINKIISETYDYSVVNQLSLKNLKTEIINSKSFNKRKKDVERLFNKYKIETRNTKIIDKLTYQFIPSGTKGVFRGNKFNKIIENKLKETFPQLDISVEGKEIGITEKYDFKITDGQKILIGMNQIDFWSGGHQINRADKYITIGRKFNDEKKFICVIADFIKINSLKNKAMQIVAEGLIEEIIFYPKGLIKFVEKFFNLNV